MAVYISPNTAQELVVGRTLCFTGNAVVTIDAEDLAHLDMPTSGATWTYNYSSWVFKKTGGSNETWADCSVITDATVYGLQPFHIEACNSTFVTPASPYRNVHWFIGLVDDADTHYRIEVMKYCNNATVPNCNQVSSSGVAWILAIDIGTARVYERNVNFNERFRIRSDGATLFFEHFEGGVLIRDHYIELPTTTVWRMEVGAAYIGNEITCAGFIKGRYQGNIPVTWSHPMGGVLIENGNTACFSSDSAGPYQVCVASEFDDPLCVDINVAALTFTPIGLSCDECVFLGETVNFESNGGLDGTLVVVDELSNPAGTVLSALSWQAPGNSGTYIATYSLGEDEVSCTINVIEPLQVLNIAGDTISGLAPGESVQLLTNYEWPNIVWENVDCPNIVSPTGLVSIPSRLNDDCFGSLDCVIRCRLVDTPEADCPNLTSGVNQVYVDLRVLVDPVYPTPEFGGPKPLKWKPETPEYKVQINEFEGGCDETYLKNRVAIQKWTVRYAGLRYEVDNPCYPQPECDEPQGYIDGYDQSYQVAKRLDDFWNLVAGTSGYFTLKDPRTGIVWKRVRFNGTMERDHINWYTTQSRDFQMAWHPCCATGPLGGVCIHDTVIDNIPPSAPTSPSVTVLSQSEIKVFWTAATDNVGIKEYEIEVSDFDDNVLRTFKTGNSTPRYVDTGLRHSTTRKYRIRAYDFLGNFSPWSSLTVGTTFAGDDGPPSIPGNVRVEPAGPYAMNIYWDSSVDDNAIDHYMLLVAEDRGARRDPINVGLVTEFYYDFNLQPGIKYAVYVKAVDTYGKSSSWSLKVTCRMPYE
jgi:hypothetical protein